MGLGFGSVLKKRRMGRTTDTPGVSHKGMMKAPRRALPTASEALWIEKRRKVAEVEERGECGERNENAIEMKIGRIYW